MKTKYERMSKEEKRKINEIFKKDKNNLYKKFRTMYMLIIIGVIYSVIVFIYDLLIKKSTFNYILDIIIFIFCLLVLIKINNTKKDILNNIALKK